ncbi:MAG TPA: transglycosylase SLT domain-containing protein, partial [Longimicrobiales bacterium]|nr:transglycosylase SLT domain-containing protein [Longimicrobiales bacterium]
VRALRAADAASEAARVAERAAGQLATSVERASAWAMTGTLRLETGDTAGAREAYRRAMVEAPGTAAGVEGARGMWALPALTPADQLQVGRIYLRHGNRQRGIAGLTAYLDGGAGTAAERAELRLDVGRALFESGDYAAAERALLALAGEEGVPARVGAEALYTAGRAQYRRGQGEAGQRTLLSVARRFPGQDAGARGLFLVGDLSHDAGQTTRARELYRGAVESVPGLYESGLAMMRLGGLAFLEGKHREAAELYEEYLRSFPDGRRAEQALYWAARAYQALGEEEAAQPKLTTLRSRDPLSWYGLRAADLLGEGFWALPLGDDPPEEDAAAGRVARAMDRLDLLEALGRADMVDHEIGRIRRAFAGEPALEYALAEALNARGHTLTAIRMGWEIREREGAWNARLLRIVHPFPYRDLILAEARERKLDPWLVAGLIRRESVFKAGIRSPAGAVGLMQVMPPTGTGLARQAGVRPYREALLEQPDINVHLGTMFLRELMDRYGGRLVPVLAAYNAGPTRVARWRELPEYADEELFAERIPYAETRDYVKIVQAHARIYEALYGGAVPARGE